MNPAAPYAYAALLGILAWSAWSDVKTERIPNIVTIPAIFAGIVFWVIAALVMGESVTGALKASAYAGLVAFVASAFFFIVGGLIGPGDVKIMTVVGTWSASYYCIMGTAFYALLLIIPIGIYTVIKKGHVKQTVNRFYMALMSLAAKKAPDLENDDTKIPLVVCIFVGAAFAGIEHMLGYKFPWT
jgi:prepilin peptidase CpaA